MLVWGRVAPVVGWFSALVLLERVPLRGRARARCSGCSRRNGIVSVRVFLYSALLMGRFSALIFVPRL